MAGIADLLYLGQPDPSRQLAALLSGQQQQPSQQPPQGAGPPGSPPSPGGPGAVQPPAPPQPQAYQSPPDLQAANQQLASPPNIMSLYLQMQQRENASNQINRGLALIAANHSMPSMRQSIMESVGGGSDAGQTVGNLMSLYQAQNQMGAQQALLGQADAIDQKNGWPAGTARAEILAGRGPDLVKAMEPSDLVKNYNWAIAKAKADNPNATPAELENAAQGILLGAGAGGMGGADAHDRLRAIQQFHADPANAGQPTPPWMLTDEKFKLYNTDLSDAKTQFNGINNALGGPGGFIDKMSKVSNNPALDNVAGSAVSGTVRTWVPNSPEKQVLADMSGLGDTAKDLGSRGGPKGLGQNLKTIGSSPADFTNLNYSDYRGQVIAPRMQQALTAQANAYGASGQLSQMPGYLRPYLDKMYSPGGEFDPGGGFKPFTPSKDPNIKQPTEADKQEFKNYMERYGPEAALAKAEKNGYDTSSLR